MWGFCVRFIAWPGIQGLGYISGKKLAPQIHPFLKAVAGSGFQPFEARAFRKPQAFFFC